MEIEQSKGDRISTSLKEAIALHNEVNLRLGDSNGGYDYQAFIDVVCNFAGSENLVLCSLSQILNNHKDLLLKFHSFLTDSGHKATSFSETVPLRDKDGAKDLESQTLKFLKKLRSRIGDNGVDMFVVEFQTRGWDKTKIKCVAEKCMGEFPADLTKEFDDIIQRYMEVDEVFLQTHEGMNNFDRLMKHAFDKYQRNKNRNLCPCQISTDHSES